MIWTDPCSCGQAEPVIDLNDLRVFERVAALSGFSAAARALGLPKSSVTRSVQRLEIELATRLMQRTTRAVVLTETGTALFERCAEMLGRLSETIDYVGSLSHGPRGCLRISTGIGFGVNVLGELLPEFTQRYPNVEIILDLSSQTSDLIGSRFDVAIRMGPMPDSQIVARKLGELNRYVCASPVYLDRRGTPTTFDDLGSHDLVDLLLGDGVKSRWRFKRAGELVEFKQSARISVNDALTIHRLLVNGAGIGITSGYLCSPDIKAGRLVRLFSDWMLPAVQVHAIFPSQRELAPAVRAFIDFMREQSRDGHHWQNDPIESGAEVDVKP